MAVSPPITSKIDVPPDNPHLPEYLGVIRHLLYRDVLPVKSITLDTINEESAMRSPYLPALRDMFDIEKDHRAITIYGRLHR